MASVFEELQEGWSEGGPNVQVGIPSCALISHLWNRMNDTQTALLCINPLPCLEVHSHPAALGSQELSVWTKTSINASGIRQYYVTNLWNRCGTNICYCAPEIQHQHTAPSPALTSALLIFVSYSSVYFAIISAIPTERQDTIQGTWTIFSNLNGLYPEEARRKPRHSNTPREPQSSDSTPSNGRLRFP